MKSDCRAIVLLGPTGSGKTPLGEAIEKRGFRGQRTAHFDFGASLRAAVANPSEYPLLTSEEVALLEDTIRRNALLEDNEFPVAEKMLLSFIATRHLGSGDLIVLNGLPRHAGQAEAVGALVTVEEVLFLDCSEEVVRHRIAADEGGDRGMRGDDSAPEIERKLRIFIERTLPLLEYYRAGGVPVQCIRIATGMGVEEVLAAVFDTDSEMPEIAVDNFKTISKLHPFG